MNKLNLKIIAPISVAILIGTLIRHFHPVKKRAKAKKALTRLRTIANKLIREKIWQIYFLAASSVKYFRGGTIISAAASISVLVKYKSATFITNYVQNFDVSFVSEDYIAFVFNQHTNTGGSGNDSTSSKIFYRASGKEIYIVEGFH
jgi:hypothetical protein